MYTDFHCHILPKIDDGARDITVSKDILACLKKENVTRIIATPHFYPHKSSLSDFLNKRERAYKQLIDELNPDIQILRGAEVYAVHGFSNLENIGELCIEGTNSILIELPYAPLSRTLLEEIYNISVERDIIPIFAHIERYLNYANTEELYELVGCDNYYFQVNCESVTGFLTQKKCIKLIEHSSGVLLGSDTHNDLSRAKSYNKAVDILAAKFGKRYADRITEVANSFFE